MRAFTLTKRDTDPDLVGRAFIVVISFACVEVDGLPVAGAAVVGIAHAGSDCTGQLTFAGGLTDEDTVSFISGCGRYAAGVAIVGSRRICVAAGVRAVLDGCLRQAQVEARSSVGVLSRDGRSGLGQDGPAGEQTEEKDGVGFHCCRVLVEQGDSCRGVYLSWPSKLECQP